MPATTPEIMLAPIQASALGTITIRLLDATSQSDEWSIALERARGAKAARTAHMAATKGLKQSAGINQEICAPFFRVLSPDNAG